MLEVWIRTFSDRLYLAKGLKDKCDLHFANNSRILNTKDGCPQYTYKYILALYYAILNSSAEHILLLEDDIELNAHAPMCVRAFCKKDLPIVWMSIPSSDIVTQAHSLGQGLFLLSNFNHMHYSGAILCKRDLLKHFVENYLLNHLEFEYPQFDIQLSRFVNAHFGSLWLAPNLFFSNPRVASALDNAPFQISGRHYGLTLKEFKSI
jgi:hypothetical protein